MREILFRGRCEASGEWLEGDLVNNAYDGSGMTMRMGIQKPGYYPRKVITETVGQFTGLKDKDDKRIFEGDVLVTLWGDECNGVVEYSGTYGMYEYVCKSRNFKYDFVSTQSDEYKIIGNIHENPELIK